MDTSKYFEKHSLIPVVVKDYSTGEVLNIGFMNKDALEKTLSTLDVWYCSRTTHKLWKKNRESAQRLISIHADCDNDALLLRVMQTGNCCHKGHSTCFYKRIWPEEHSAT